MAKYESEESEDIVDSLLSEGLQYAGGRLCNRFLWYLARKLGLEEWLLARARTFRIIAWVFRALYLIVIVVAFLLLLNALGFNPFS